MPSIAITKDIIDISVQNHKHKMLGFDQNGKIIVYNFDIIKQTLTHWDKGKIYREELNFNEITNSAILFAIARKLKKEIGKDFNGGNAIQALQDNMSDSITNKKEVATEIYESWLNLSKKEKFIHNVTEGQVRVESSEGVRGMLPSLVPIPNFPGFIQGLIDAYLRTAATEPNIHAWTITQSIELFLSSLNGTPFTKNKAKNVLIVNQVIDFCCQKTPKLKNELITLQKKIEEEQGMWLTSLKGYIGFEIESLLEDLEDSQKKKVALTLTKIINAKQLTDQEKENYKTIIDCFIPEGAVYQSMIKADISSGKQKPDWPWFVYGIQYAITKAAKDNNLALEEFINNNNKSVAPTSAKQINLKEISRNLNQIGQHYHLTTDSDFVEATLLKVFGINSTLQAAQFITEEEYASSHSDIDFYLGISEESARELVNKINALTPNSAMLKAYNVYLENKGATKLQHLVINRQVFCETIIPSMQSLLKDLFLKDFDFFEKHQIESNTRKSTREQYAQELLQLAMSICPNAYGLGADILYLSNALKANTNHATIKPKMKAVMDTLATTPATILSGPSFFSIQRVKIIQEELKQFHGIDLASPKP